MTMAALTPRRRTRVARKVYTVAKRGGGVSEKGSRKEGKRK
jgi:hypothetical protein